MKTYEIETEKRFDGWWATCFDPASRVTGEMRRPKQSEPAAIKVAVANCFTTRGPEEA